jgi:hypothetical protein
MSKQTPKPVSEGTLTRCKNPECQSTDREKYFGTPITLDISGVDRNGKPYNRKVMKRTRCAKCGQQRLDSFFEFTEVPKRKK